MMVRSALQMASRKSPCTNAGLCAVRWAKKLSKPSNPQQRPDDVLFESTNSSVSGTLRRDFILNVVALFTAIVSKDALRCA